MAKYVCDFEVARQYVSQVNNQVENLNKRIDTYNETILKTISGWNGIASDAFRDKNSNMVSLLKSSVTEISRYAQFVNNSINKIADLEAELSSRSI